MTVEHIFCTNCGVEIESGASFCSSCGTETGSADEKVSSSIDAEQGEAAPWFYENNGERTGGFTESQMVGLIQSGEIGYGTSVWKHGLDGWTKAEKTDLEEHLVEVGPPPLKGANVSNGTVWVLALAPAIGLVLEYLIAGIIYSDSPDPDWMAGTGLSQSDLDVFNAVESGSLFFVTVILNIALSILDERRLRKAGWDTSKIKGMVWLVPVYLFKRAKLLEQNMAYFIVWLVAFGLVFFNMI